MTDKIVINFDSWKIKQIDRTRDRMKLQIKLSKDEALAFRNFMGMVKPPEIAEDDFLKGIFKIGVETMEMKLMEAVQQHAEENNLDPSSVGIDPIQPEETENEVQADKTD
tara:strand:+ start:515 stop:844 length:330 start_codon:yes stop_codon:yes gene_type:complete